MLENTQELSEEDGTEQSGELPANLDWRQYFNMDELTSAFEKIQKGEDPNDEEDKGIMSVDNGSDSCPSDDNLDMKELYTAIYLEKNKMAQAMQLRQAAEGDYDRNFANFVKKVTKKIRDTSKGSRGLPDHHLQHLHKDGETCERCKSRLEEHKQEVQKKLSGIIHLEVDAKQQQEDIKSSKGKLTLLIKGQSNKDSKSIDPPETEKRKGRDFNIKKRSSAQGMHSPNQNIMKGKANTIADRRLKSQEARPDLEGNKELKKGLNVLKPHRSKVTGIDMKQSKLSAFAPILTNKLSIATVNQDLQNLDLSKQQTSHELKVSESNQTQSLYNGQGYNTANPTSNYQPNSTVYSNGFGDLPGDETIMEEESDARITPMGAEPYRPNMAARTDGFNTNGMMQLNLPSQDFGRKQSAMNNHLQSLTTQKLLPDHIGNQKRLELHSRQQQMGSPNRTLAGINQPLNLNASNNYTKQFVQQALPQNVKNFEQELIRKQVVQTTGQSTNTGQTVMFGHQGNLSGNSISLSGHAGASAARFDNTTTLPSTGAPQMRSPAPRTGGIPGSSMFNMTAMTKASRSPGPPNTLTMKPPVNQAANSLGGGVSGMGIDQRIQNLGNGTRAGGVKQFRSPQQQRNTGFQRPSNTFGLGHVNQSQNIQPGGISGSSMQMPQGQISSYQQKTSQGNFATAPKLSQVQMRSPRRNLVLQSSNPSQQALPPGSIGLRSPNAASGGVITRALDTQQRLRSPAQSKMDQLNQQRMQFQKQSTYQQQQFNR